jgi:nucleotide-binding universal stress UspA family protein
VNPIVVGVDDSPGSRRALAWATEVARATDAEIVAVSAFTQPWSEVSPDDQHALIAEREQRLVEWTRPAVESGASVRTQVIPGDPRDVLESVAADESAALIVVGRTGHGTAPGLLHIGSVGEHLAHHVPYPLAVVPTDAPLPVERIVVGVDRSAGSQRAVAWCAQLASAAGAHVVAARIDDEPTEHPVDVVANAVTSDESDFDEECRLLFDAGVDVEQVVELNPSAAHGLLELAAARGADLLIVGARGRGGFSGLRVGGVAMKVLHHATGSIVLVPDR